ncbi:ESF1 homolog [Biomphalaria glabrata]|uniref:ESF1 homolog n=1 Tax=Biomphalaria glabrata TaxID=6526 RepID=A0A9U8EJY7_BIOGL|nr:ESF1 homolog [Biomphalaria glabrata]
MEEIKNDPRFAHIATDPIFRSMPKTKRKIKIDSRFHSLFTNSDFSIKTDKPIDKRGRPVLDWAKKSKNAMERFYHCDSDSDDDHEDEPEEQLEETCKTDKIKTEVKKKSKKDRAAKREENSLKNKKREEALPSKSVLKNKTKKKSVKDEKHISEDDLSEEENNPESTEKETNGINGDADKDSETGDDSGTGEDSETDSDDSDDDSELPEFTEEFALQETEIDHKWNEQFTDAPDVTQSTHRLAVCNMDWDFVHAKDLYLLFKSFAPKDGQVKKVTIYPSEFGKERMAEESMLGPKEIREGVKMDTESDDDDNKGGKKQKKIKDQQKLKQYARKKKAAQTEKLREYQLNRLRYYYAVVECDSVRTADTIYSECDGREYQLSSVRLDLRFIPDDMTFDDESRESFSEEESIVGYQPAKFNTTALSQAKVDVTWDETEFDRLSRHISSLPQKDLESIVEENKYADIIAPPDSDSEEDDDDQRPAWLKAALANTEDKEKELTEEEKIQLYRKVLMDALADDEEEKKKEEGETDKEIEWQPGLKDKVQKKINKKEKKVDNAIVSEFLEKKKEKKKKKKEKLKKKSVNGEEPHAFSDDELPDLEGIDSLKELMEGEKVSVKSKKNKKKKPKDEVVDEAGEKAKAELELMLMDDGTSEKKLSKPELVKDSKKKKKKKAKALKRKNAEDDQVEDFKLNVEDPRFSALYTSHLFHIDPTAPQFKKTKNMMKLVDEQIKRKKPKLSDTETNRNFKKTETYQDVVESLKRKMKS